MQTGLNVDDSVDERQKVTKTGT